MRLTLHNGSEVRKIVTGDDGLAVVYWGEKRFKEVKFSALPLNQGGHCLQNPGMF